MNKFSDHFIYNNLEVAPVYFDGEITKYVISKTGRVFNTKSGKELKWKKDTRGYWKVTISHKGVAKDKRIHTLVALGFVENPNPEKYNIVNHIDGNKLNPIYTNLEWTDFSGNMRHAIDNGLIPILRGEDKGRAILTNDQVHQICKLMEDGNTTQRELSKLFNVHEATIHEIRAKRNWTHISCQYNIDNCKVDVVPLKESIVREICEEIEKSELTLMEISKKFGVKYGVVLTIFTGKTFSSISNEYDFSHYSKRKPGKWDKLREYENRKIIELMHDGKSNNEIISKLNLPHSSRTNTRLFRLRKSNGL